MSSYNSRALKYMKQKLRELKGVINKSTITVGEFNTLLLIDRASTGKISQNTENIKNSINQFDLLTFIKHFTHKCKTQVMFK